MKDANYLISKAGDMTVRISTLNKGALPAREGFAPLSSHYEMVNFGDFMQEVENVDLGNVSASRLAGRYMNQQRKKMRTGPYSHPLGRFLKDFGTPSFFASAYQSVEVNMWIGVADPVNGSIAALHNDALDNLYLLVRGRKKFTLFPPDDIANLYPNRQLASVERNGVIYYARLGHTQNGNTTVYVYNTSASASASVSAGKNGDNNDHVDVDDHHHQQRFTASRSRAEPDNDDYDDDGPVPNFSLAKTLSDFESFPKLKKLRPVICELEEGDMLFLPAGWWHEVGLFWESRKKKKEKLRKAF